MSDKTVATLIRGGKIDHVEADQSVMEAIRHMARVKRGAVPVIAEGQLVGMFSERDLMLRVILAERDPEDTPVREVMSKDLVVAKVDDPVVHCLAMMHKMHFRHLPVVEEGRLVGVISLRDLMKIDADTKAEAIDMLNYYVGYSPE
jgi:CBS domain-containing protein